MRRPQRLPRFPAARPAYPGADLELVDALAHPRETRPLKPDQAAARAGVDAPLQALGGAGAYELYDKIWLSPRLAARQMAAWIYPRTKHGGDGSDHAPTWVALSL